MQAEIRELASLATSRIRIERFAVEPVDQKSVGALHFSRTGSETGLIRKQMWPRFRRAMTEIVFGAFGLAGK